MHVDKVTLEILANHFRACAEDMARVIARTSFTTFVNEATDFGAGLAAPNGEYVSFAFRVGVPLFLGINTRKAIETIPHYDEGDIVVLNDPYTSGALSTHLPDTHLIKPIFHQGEIIAYAYAFVHSSDIGGTVPASVWPKAQELFQEGLRLRPVKLVKRGELNQDVLNVILDNCRIPEMNWGDVKAMIAGLNTCERRLHEMIAKFGVEMVKGGIVDLLDLVAERARKVLATIPDGTYRFVDYLEDDLFSEAPIRLALTMTAKDGNIHLDYTGSDPQVSSALNIPSDGGPHPFMALGLLCYIFTHDRDIPKAGSVMRPITMTLPKGTVVNPEFPASCGVRFAGVFRLTDTVLGCLAQAVPGKVPAAPAGAVSPVVCSLTDPATGKRHVTVVEAMIGGGAGRADGDGVHGADSSQGTIRNTPVESAEADIPIVIRRYDLIPDSAGPGKHRAGMAVRLDFQVYHPNAVVTARGQERFKMQPWGAAGGSCGTAGNTIVNPDSANPRVVGKIGDFLRLDPGDVVSIRAPAGGGHGDPLARDPVAVATDVRAEFVSPEAARNAYGVVLSDGRVDTAATAALRDRLRAERGPLAYFDYGPFRRALEERWPVDVSGECAQLVNTLPTAVRDYAKHRIFDAVQAIARVRRPEAADVQAAFADVQARLERALS